MRLLCIDDKTIRFRKLAAKGIECVVTHHPNQLAFYLENYPADHWDAVLLAHNMPILTGYQLAIDFLTHRGLYVIVHSANNIAARNIMHVLEEYTVPSSRWNVLEEGWTEGVIELALKRKFIKAMVDFGKELIDD